MGGGTPEARVVLCVDDSKTVQHAFELTLRGSGYAHVGARTMREAIALAAEHAPVLILADAVLPDGSGYELCATLRADPRLAEVPLLILRGASTAYDERRATEVGADGDLVKPWDTDALLARIAELLDSPPTMRSASRPAAARAAPARPAPAPAPAKRAEMEFEREAEPAGSPPWLAPGESLAEEFRPPPPKSKQMAAYAPEDDDDLALAVELPAEPVAAPGPSPVFDGNVQFTVYRPRAVAPGTWHKLLAFAHLSENPPDAPPDAADPLDQVREEAAALLGKQAADYQDVTQDSGHAVPRMGELTFVPEIAGVTFNPPRASLLWVEPVHRVDFKLLASPALQGQTARGRLTVFLGGIILAEVTLSIRVDAGAGKQDARPEPARARAYRRIFASYSHRDTAIVEQFETYARAVGDECVRDWVHLRSGQVWTEQLCRLIEQADVFQLFWSSSSMRSQFVRQEWEHALSLRRPSFVRPTYWEDPLPRDEAAGLPPSELRQLHFQRIGFPSAAADSAPARPKAAKTPSPGSAQPQMFEAEASKPVRAPARREAPARRWLPVLILLLLLIGALGFAAYYFLPAT